MAKNQTFKSGFVTILGRPNVGKSTILNYLIGEKIAIISQKPQTTRNKITGVMSKHNYQIVFLDTPGIHKPKNKLDRYMEKISKDSLEGVDCVLYVVDSSRYSLGIDEDIIKSFRSIKTPIILILNKIDLISKEELLPIINKYSSLYNFKAVIPISAIDGEYMEDITKEIINIIPEGPKYFPDDMITDQPERQIIAELVREKILSYLDEEVPHGIAVEIESMKKKENSEIFDIQATIYCERKSHKGIIIGKNGKMLKNIGTKARIDIEKLLGNKVFLQLWVKVKKDWRNSEMMIKNFGYK